MKWRSAEDLVSLNTPATLDQLFATEPEDKTMWLDVDAWNGLGQRVLDTITQGREVVVTGRLAISEYTKEINGVKVKMSKPLIKLTSFHLCGKKPVSEGETTSEEKSETKKRKLATVNG